MQSIFVSITMLSVANLSKSFGHLTAVNNVSFTIRDGESIGLIGPNGAGKTTLIRCLIGSLRMDTGSVKYGSLDLLDHTVDCKRLLGFVPEIPYPYDYLTPWEHLSFVSSVWELEHWESRTEALLKEFGLWQKKDEATMRLSKGMKQKTLICMALIHDPKVLIMDEPLIGVDPLGQKAIKDHIRALRASGSSILLSTHALPLVEEVCDRFLILDYGSMVAEGTMQEIRQKSESLESILLRTTAYPQEAYHGYWQTP